MRRFFFLFPLLLFCTGCFAVEIHVTKDKESLFLDDKLYVTITGDYEESLSPCLFELVENLPTSLSESFFLLSSKKEERPGHFELSFELQPAKEGPLYFTPGFLSFFSKEGGVQDFLIDAFTIEAKRREGALSIAPARYVRQEDAIILDENLKDIVFRKGENVQVPWFFLRAAFWNVLIIFIVVASMGTVLWLCFLQLREYFAKKAKAQEVLHPEKEIARLLEMEALSKKELNALSLNSRLLLGIVLKKECSSFSSRDIAEELERSELLIPKEKERLIAFFFALDKALFSPEEEQEFFQKNKDALLLLLQLFTALHEAGESSKS
jgi:hypothetical protein